MKKNPVIHFELPFADKDRAAAFYEKAFGWKVQMLGPEMGEYVIVQTGDTDEKGMLEKPGMINGGMYKKTKDDQHPSIVIAVDDIHEAMKMVTGAGGTVIGGSQGVDKPDAIPGVGLFAAFIDSEGNRGAILQPNER